ncbi:MAG: glycosyltransferase family 4 protein [Acidimicrobiales bacterium]
MPVTTVHQLLPALLPGDAVGSHTLEVRRTLRDLGLESEIFCEAVHPQLEGEGRHFSELPPPGPRGMLVYQLAIGSVLADVVHARPGPLVVDYHNVTPAGYFRSWDAKVAAALTLARQQLGLLADKAVLGLGDSAFNVAEMEEVGYDPTAVVPILLDLSRLGGRADPAVSDRLLRARAGGGADLLFVGRIAPNKAQEDLVKALAAYRAVYDPRARLHLVGRAAADSYVDGLRRFVAGAGLADAVEIADGGVSHEALCAYYQSADVFVGLSEHEGFCVPLLEAMHHRLPVVAYGAAAVPETLGEGGIVLATKHPLTVAAAVHRLVDDPGLREAVVAAGEARLAEFALERSRVRLVRALAPFTGIDALPTAAGGPPQPPEARP